MKRFFVSRRFQRLNLPGALLMTLLQRTPVLRAVAAAGYELAASPVGNVLRSAITAVASLGAIESMAGATPLSPSAGTATGITVTVGQSVSVLYTVTGTQTPPASWTITGDIPPGLNFSGLTSPGTVNVQDLKLSGTPTSSGTFNVTIQAWEGPNGSLISTEAYKYAITVNGSSGGTATLPAFTTQPVSQTVAVGGNATFVVAVTGTPAPTLQWEKDGTNIPGATDATLTLSNVQSANAGAYTAVANNSAGSKSSNPATLTVSTPGTAPTITTQPVPQTVLIGDTIVFTGAANGSPAAALQWKKDGAALTDGGRVSGTASGTLTINTASASDAGTYTLVASNSAGAVTSTGVLLTVNPAPVSSSAAWLSNLSVRTTLVAGQNPVIVGLSVRGGAKTILMRGAGPALTAFGLTNVMADPKLDLYDQNTSPATFVTSQDDWDASLSTVFSSLGAFGFQAGSKDAAFVHSLNGSFTVQAPATGPGTVLVEAYDTNPSVNSPRLVNISARNRVGTGADVLIEGFAITGSGTKKLLVRAVGPGLGAFGLTGFLADPKLEVYNSDNQMVAANDNWDSSLSTTFSAVGAFGLTAGSKDAAMVVPLASGHTYTVLVRGADGGTGEALVEVYEIP